MSKGKILIVDDEMDLVSTLKFRLEIKGYEVISAYDGQDAIDKVYREKPDLIFLDIQLPGINGYAVCKKLKEDPQTKDIPIIVMSIMEKPSDKAWALGMGADEYIDKPFKPEKILEIVKEKLKI